MSLGLGALLAGSLLLFCGLAGYKLIPALQGRLERQPALDWTALAALLGGLFAAKAGLGALGDYLRNLPGRGGRGGTGRGPTTIEPGRPRTPLPAPRGRLGLPRGFAG